MADDESAVLNLATVSELFSQCMTDDNDVLLDPYINAYSELYRLFGLLGTVFGFVAADVRKKLAILREHRCGAAAAHYETAGSMVRHEQRHRVPPSGSRTLLRLHRALRFIVDFLQRVCAASDADSLAAPAAQAYDGSLAAHHAWLVRGAVRLAVHTLPTKRGLMERLRYEDEDECNRLITTLVATVTPVYDAIQNMYSERQLLDLS